MFRYVEKRPFPIDFLPTPTFSVLSVGVTDDDGVVFQFRSTYTIYETFRKLQDENDGMGLRLIMTLPHHNVFDSEPYVLKYLKKHPSRFLEIGMYGENTFSMVGDPDVHKAMLKELRDVMLEEFSHINQMIYIDGVTRKVVVYIALRLHFRISRKHIHGEKMQGSKFVDSYTSGQRAGVTMQAQPCFGRGTAPCRRTCWPALRRA